MLLYDSRAIVFAYFDGIVFWTPYYLPAAWFLMRYGVLVLYV